MSGLGRWLPKPILFFRKLSPTSPPNRPYSLGNKIRAPIRSSPRPYEAHKCLKSAILVTHHNTHNPSCIQSSPDPNSGIYSPDVTRITDIRHINVPDTRDSYNS